MIALAMILKDTEPIDMIARCLYSVGPHVDGIYFTVTHTTKKPSKAAEALAKELKVLCVSKGYPEPEISYFKWIKDFSAARNYNFKQVPQKFTWLLWLDADDILRGGKHLRSISEQAEKVNAGAVFFNYLYRVELDEDLKIKNVLIEHLRERLIRNDGSYKWVAPIHETLIEQRQTNKTDSKLCDVVHLSNDERMQSAIYRNIEVLETQLKSQGNKQDPRTVYYLGKAYFDLHTPEYHDRAEELILRYLQGSDLNTPSGWAEERSQAWDYLGEIYRGRREFNKAIKATLNALEEGPQFPMPYINMALNYVYKKEWAKAKHWARLSQQVPYPKTTLVLNPRDMQARVLEVLFNIGANTNNIEEAHAAATKLAEIFPQEKSVVDRYLAMNELKNRNEIAHAVIRVAQHLASTGQRQKLQAFVKGMPAEIENEPLLLQLRRDVLPEKTWADNEIAIVCGPGFEKWSPKNLAKGLGGSEEAVIYNSRELAKLGWDVTVYGDPDEQYEEKILKNRVIYKSHFEFNPKDSFNILIGWRNVGFFDTDWKAKKKYLWLHDVQNPMEYTKERVDKIDKVMVLSEAHKKTVVNDLNKEWLTNDKFMLTGNGIFMEQFDIDPPERDPHRCIWTSSYDRGLEHLLDIWPDVIDEVPTANLQIFYGWNLFDVVHHNNPERKAWKAKIEKKMEQKGITHHGRVGQQQIIEETMKSSFWTYPTHFYEISCITAMKCQAAGCVPIVCDYAALRETVQYGVKINVDEEDIFDAEKKEEYKKALINALKKNNFDREEMVKWARNKFSWENIAAQWDKEFKS